MSDNVMHVDEAALAERKRFLTAAVPFCVQMLQELGNQLTYIEHRFYTQESRALIGFAGFRFLGEYSITEMGDNRLRVHSMQVGYTGQELLDVRWKPPCFDVNNCQVNYFHDSPQWVQSLQAVISDPGPYISAFREAEAERCRKADVEVANAKRMQQLTNEAQQFGFAA